MCARACALDAFLIKAKNVGVYECLWDQFTATKFCIQKNRFKTISGSSRLEMENSLSCHPNRVESNESGTTTTVIKRLAPKWMINPSLDTNIRCMQKGK